MCKGVKEVYEDILNFYFIEINKNMNYSKDDYNKNIKSALCGFVSLSIIGLFIKNYFKNYLKNNKDESIQNYFKNYLYLYNIFIVE